MTAKPIAMTAVVAATAITCLLLLRRLDRHIGRRASVAGMIENWEGEGGALAPEGEAAQTSQVRQAVPGAPREAPNAAAWRAKAIIAARTCRTSPTFGSAAHPMLHAPLRP